MDDVERKRVKRRICKILGVDECTSGVEVLRHVAETLGCTVSSTVFRQDDGENGSARKRSALNGQQNDEPELETGSEGEGPFTDDSDVLEDEFIRPLQIEQSEINKCSSLIDDSLTGSRNGRPNEFMEWLIHPLQLEDFYKHLFEQQPALIRRPLQVNYFSNLLDFDSVRTVIAEQDLRYGMDLDVTRYDEKGGRKTLNYNSKSKDRPKVVATEEMEIADHSLVWKRFHKRGCSIRLRRPALHFTRLRRLMGALEEFWQVPVGANVYVTPPGSQGFAPHFDDIDAFILQVEGAKLWRLYAPTDPRNVLPRRSSRDFNPRELGQMTMEVVLQPGDTLYLPRGCVHEAESMPDAHSMHVTLSVNQDSSWQRLFESTLPRAVALASSKWRVLRASVPRDLNIAFGTAPLPQVNPDNQAIQSWLSRRQEVEEMCQEMLTRIAKSVDLDWAADQFKSDFLSKRLPPEDVDGQKNKKKRKISRVLDSSSKVRVLHPGTTQLIIHADDGDNTVSVVTSVHNDIEYHVVGREPQGSTKKGVLNFPAQCTPVLLNLLGAQGEVALSDLSSPDGNDNDENDDGDEQHPDYNFVVEIAQNLCDAGILC